MALFGLLLESKRRDGRCSRNLDLTFETKKKLTVSSLSSGCLPHGGSPRWESSISGTPSRLASCSGPRDVYGNTQRLRMVGGTENDRNNLAMTDDIGQGREPAAGQPPRSRSSHNIGSTSSRQKDDNIRPLTLCFCTTGTTRRVELRSVRFVMREQWTVFCMPVAPPFLSLSPPFLSLFPLLSCLCLYCHLSWHLP